MSTDEHIGEVIHELLAESNRKQKQLAQALETSESTVSHILNGTQPLTPKQLIDTSKFLGVRVDYILGLSPDKDEKTYRTRLLLALLGRMTNTEEFRNRKRDIIAPADMEFTKTADNYTMLIGSPCLFSLIDEAADLNSRHRQGALQDNEYNELIKRAWKKYGTSKCKKKSGRLLISPKQLKAEEEKAKGIAKLLDHLSEQEI